MRGLLGEVGLMSRLRSWSLFLLTLSSVAISVFAFVALLLINSWDPLRNVPDPNMSALGIVAVVWGLITSLALIAAVIGLGLAFGAFIFKTQHRLLAALGLALNSSIIVWATIYYALLH